MGVIKRLMDLCPTDDPACWIYNRQRWKKPEPKGPKEPFFDSTDKKLMAVTAGVVGGVVGSVVLLATSIEIGDRLRMRCNFDERMVDLLEEFNTDNWKLNKFDFRVMLRNLEKHKRFADKFITMSEESKKAYSDCLAKAILKMKDRRPEWVEKEDK